MASEVGVLKSWANAISIVKFHSMRQPVKCWKNIFQLCLLRLSFCFLQTRQKELCQNAHLATLSKSMLMQRNSPMLAHMICDIVSDIAWLSLFRSIDWPKLWDMTHWTQRDSIFKG